METYLFKQIAEGNLDFYGIEQIVWRAALCLFQHLMEKILVEIDKYLMVSRDTTRYELKERNRRTIETLVGPVEIERRYYWDKKEKRWVYLLGKLYEGSLPEQLSRHLAEKEEWMLDRIKAGAGHIAKNTPTKYLAPRGGFPAIHHGTKGYAALFKEILKPDSL